MNHHQEALRYAQLLWNPKPGQRVIYKGQRYRVEEVSPEREVKLVNRAGWLLAGQVTWRPTPEDFNAVLDKISDLFVYHEKSDQDRHVLGITCNHMTIPLKGRAVQVLSQILRLRTVDSKISVIINREFEAAFKSKEGSPGVRLILVEQPKEDSSPT